MQVTIKYSQQYGQCAGGVETLNTQMLQEYDRWRIGFRCLAYNHHWALVIEKYINNSTSKNTEGRQMARYVLTDILNYKEEDLYNFQDFSLEKWQSFCNRHKDEIKNCKLK